MSETKQQETEFHQQRNEHVDRYLKKVLKPFLPNAKISSVYSMGAVGRPFGGATIQISPSNKSLLGSKYYYNKQLKFIHYTSLRNALNILREKAIRLYDLNSMNDPLELSHSIKSLLPEKSDHLIDDWKQTVFCLSMCDFRREEEKKNFDNWRIFGDNGKGIGMVLSFPKYSQKNWLNRYLSHVYYKDIDLKEIKKFFKRHNDFIEKNGFNIRDPIKNLILHISCFHKVGIYENENEVRYLYIIDKKSYQDHDSKEVETDIVNNKQVYYTRLPLDRRELESRLKNLEFKTEEKQRIRRLFPEVKVEQIILGYDYQKSDVWDIKRVVNQLSQSNLGYQVDVKISELKEYFKK
ncbi:MAG: hypothetical protein COA57_13800 [Flavobacteriales bacterium]|nr:MAG: hypothetical protein COA57_13800 [Flavobacteriales bacterium]